MRIVMIVCILCFISGCSPLKSTGPAGLGSPRLVMGESPGLQSAAANIPADGYVIHPGDKLSIKFFYAQELNEEDLVVRPDGYISLQLVDEVMAAGLTPTELQNILIEKYTKSLTNPVIAVILRAVKEPFKVYVDGEVKSPGEFEIHGSMTVLQAIARARGLSPTADQSEVVVIRRAHGKQPFIIKVDIEAALTGADLGQDIQLLPADLVYVPRSFW